MEQDGAPTWYWMATRSVTKTLSFDLVSHDTSICCSRIEIVPEIESTHGTCHIW